MANEREKENAAIAAIEFVEDKFKTDKSVVMAAVEQVRSAGGG